MIQTKETKQWIKYCLDNVFTKIKLSGSDISGKIDMSGNKITGIPTTTTESDALNYKELQVRTNAYLTFSETVIALPPMTTSWRGENIYIDIPEGTYFTGIYCGGPESRQTPTGASPMPVNPPINAIKAHYSKIETVDGIEKVKVRLGMRVTDRITSRNPTMRVKALFSTKPMKDIYIPLDGDQVITINGATVEGWKPGGGTEIGIG